MQNKNKRSIAIANKTMLAQIHDDVTVIKTKMGFIEEFKKDFEKRMRKVELYVAMATGVVAFLTVALNIIKVMGKL